MCRPFTCTDTRGQQRIGFGNEFQRTPIQRHRVVQLLWRARFQLQAARDFHEHFRALGGAGGRIVGGDQGRTHLGLGQTLILLRR